MGINCFNLFVVDNIEYFVQPNFLTFLERIEFERKETNLLKQNLAVELKVTLREKITLRTRG
jgi:hypothetical protein